MIPSILRLFKAGLVAAISILTALWALQWWWLVEYAAYWENWTGFGIAVALGATGTIAGICAVYKLVNP